MAQQVIPPKAHWSPEADFSRMSFFIREMNTSASSRSSEVPAAQIPLIGFIYVSAGEVLVNVDTASFLCQPGQLLLIPPQHPFAVRYYHDAVGYNGGFAPSILLDTNPLRFLSAPLHQGFWFDEGAFMGLLFQMLASASEKGDQVFIEKGLDLLLSRVRPEHAASVPPAVSCFLEAVFDPERKPGTLASYAAENCISENYLSRLVKQATGRSVGAWIDIVRIQRAKRLLAETREPIIDIAAAVGLEDQSYFSRFFKKVTGMTPSAFRLLRSAGG